MSSNHHTQKVHSQDAIKVSTETIQVDLKRLSTDIAYAKQLTRTKKQGFLVYKPSFQQLLGTNPTLTKVQSRNYQFAHEAGVYIKSTNRVYFTANYQTCKPLSVYSVDATTLDVREEGLDAKAAVNANGACNFNDSVLYCSQGDLNTPSSLTLINPADKTTSTLLNNFHGRPFNSINDVVIHHPTSQIWFTDPTYGYEQAFRPSPSLPCQIYRFDPETAEIAVVAADNFVQCNGLCFSPDYTKLYVTDTGAVQAHTGPRDGHNFSLNPRLPATVYVYDVVTIANVVSLSNKRTFAYCDTGVPDGIKCDKEGNVYSGCGDGVHVWNPQGVLIGKIMVGGLVANFCFSTEGMWMFAEEHLYLCRFGKDGQEEEGKAVGALVDIEC
jgi:gluconolactonase